ncbi:MULTISPECIES: hypothetical protein [Pseudomonas]|uniref:hypothetical protein n=1 Tax=Pseudomonas TaxID=286 RepID=UPI000A1F39F4|nr:MULTISPECIES: hypothetical protein [Pseudomonas]MCX4217171.1 hypothetical protein [Pseudomonas sp. MCal1]UDI95505.1 hypothetical protein I5961_13745 [Pseudomonas sp. IAC-BECa141]UIN53824.1 hypothetical protein LXN51_23155 [Pseudomonas kribbensis]
MKGFKRFIGMTGLALLSANAWADLPHSSILSRYGVTTDQLPKPADSDDVKPVEEKSRFYIQPEQPFVTIRIGEDHEPEMTGNLSIDRMAQQERQRCQRLQEEMVRRGERALNCDGSIPGMALPR